MVFSYVGCVPADFSPLEGIVVVNALLYASLGVMLIKSWVREFGRGSWAMSLPRYWHRWI
jgi:hypothetical protein